MTPRPVAAAAARAVALRPPQATGSIRRGVVAVVVAAAALGALSAARCETSVEVPTLTEPAGGPRTLPAYWFPADAPTGDKPAPAVVLLHGCGGLHDARGRLGQRLRAYAVLVNGLGLHALVPDSLGPRGERELCTQKAGSRKVTQAERRRDALAALAWLAAQPGVDAARLGLIGWSNGGSTVLAATHRLHPSVRAAPAAAAFAVAFYPGCEAELKRGHETDAVLLLLLGELDDWTPAAPCVQLAAEAKGRPPQVEVYAGAYHGFDSAAPLRRRLDVPGGAQPGSGVTVGGDARALRLSRERLVEFLRLEAAR